MMKFALDMIHVIFIMNIKPTLNLNIDIELKDLNTIEFFIQHFSRLFNLGTPVF